MLPVVKSLHKVPPVDDLRTISLYLIHGVLLCSITPQPKLLCFASVLLCVSSLVMSLCLHSFSYLHTAMRLVFHVCSYVAWMCVCVCVCVLSFIYHSYLL